MIGTWPARIAQTRTCTGRPNVSMTAVQCAAHAGERRHRNGCRIEDLITVLLPAVEPDALVEVALLVEEAERHEWHAQVRGGLAMVAGEDAEAT
jgi:hypothetical protein